MKQRILILLQRLFRLLGFTLQRGGTRATMGEALAGIRKLGFMPKTVIDVGIAYGTEELYAAYPEPRYLLVEPLEEYRKTLEAICRRLKGEFVIAAASDKPGKTTFHVHDILSGSSMMSETDGASADGKAREVECVTIDGLVKERKLEGPFLIKLDTQGAELLALAGATETLTKTEAVLMEVSMFQFFVGGPQLHDVAAFMHDRGFHAYDIYGGARRPIDKALAQVDVVFARDGGFLRQHHHFATPEQRARINRASGLGDPLKR